MWLRLGMGFRTTLVFELRGGQRKSGAAIKRQEKRTVTQRSQRAEHRGHRDQKEKEEEKEKEKERKI